MIGRRQIDVTDNDVVRFQIVSDGKEPAIVWLFMSGAAGFSVEYVALEELLGSGPFRIETHKGRLSPTTHATPEVRTLHTIFYGGYAEYSSSDGWAQGAGVHAQDSAMEDSAGGDFEYFTFVLFPLSKKVAGAGVRCKVSTGLNGA